MSMRGMSDIQGFGNKIRDALKRERSQTSLSSLEFGFYSDAIRFLKIEKDKWYGEQRGLPEVERRFQQWKTTKKNLNDLFIRRVRKVIIRANQQIDRDFIGNMDVGNKLDVMVPEEVLLFSLIRLLVSDTRKLLLGKDSISPIEGKFIGSMLKDKLNKNEISDLFASMMDIFDLDNVIKEGHSLDTPGSSDLPLDAADKIKSEALEKPSASSSIETSDSIVVPYEEYTGTDRYRKEKDIGEGEYLDDFPDDNDRTVISAKEPETISDEDNLSKEEQEGNNDQVAGSDVSTSLNDLDDQDDNSGDKPRSMLVRVLKDTTSFVSEDGNTYKLKKDEVVSFPYYITRILVKEGKAVGIE